jgi:hypothetical protein
MKYNLLDLIPAPIKNPQRDTAAWAIFRGEPLLFTIDRCYTDLVEIHTFTPDDKGQPCRLVVRAYYHEIFHTKEEAERFNEITK